MFWSYTQRKGHKERERERDLEGFCENVNIRPRGILRDVNLCAIPTGKE